MSIRSRRILFLVTEDWYFVSHRLELARRLVERGDRVMVATRVRRHGAVICDAGCELRPLQWRRAGDSVWEHLLALREILVVYGEFGPDIAHHVALKPVLFGSLAARMSGRPAVVNALAGLGLVFTSERLHLRLLRPILKMALRLALRDARSRVVVQNGDDLRAVISWKLANPEQVVLIRGAGVDPDDFPPGPARVGTPVVFFAGRLLWEKGVGEFVAMARELRRAGVNARFVVAGAPDSESPAAIPEAQVAAWREEGVVEWLGHLDDIRGWLQRASVFCFPTRYGEGVPRVLLEAGSAGLGLVASDWPGCREVIRHGVNGLLVPPGDVGALARAVLSLLADPKLCDDLGRAARATVIAEFTQTRVIEETAAVYRALDP